jgi:hypothetical protein
MMVIQGNGDKVVAQVELPHATLAKVSAGGNG